jgi:predicted RNase H-like nuclease (RuvC/YqgF family)
MYTVEDFMRDISNRSENYEALVEENKKLKRELSAYKIAIKSLKTKLNYYRTKYRKV